ncbi:MAG: hypothetical protein IH614_04060 [Desulfuromonadales bacterium]|nr:hypothetical protein [Desulfuromonadales bacterium]
MKDEPTSAVEEAAAEEIDLTPGLNLIRRRRWYLWAVILVYIPAMYVTLKLSSAFSTAGTVFLVWFVLLFGTAMGAAAARCPRCGNYFHMNGMTFLCLRKCLHCQLHVNADRQKKGGR